MSVITQQILKSFSLNLFSTTILGRLIISTQSVQKTHIRCLTHWGQKYIWPLLTSVILLTTIYELLSFISNFHGSIFLFFSAKYSHNAFQQILTVLNTPNSTHPQPKKIFSPVSLVSSRLQEYRSFHLKFNIIEKMSWRK